MYSNMKSYKIHTGGKIKLFFYFVKSRFLIIKIHFLLYISFSFIMFFNLNNHYNCLMNEYISQYTNPLTSIAYYIPRKANLLLNKVSVYINLDQEYEAITDAYKSLNINSMEELRSENKKLKTLLNFVESINTNFYITTSIASKIHSNSDDHILLKLGRKHGLEDGQAVINENGLIGKIIDVRESYSNILLVTNINFRAEVITEETAEKAIISGTNSNLLELNYLNDDAKLKIGEKVFTVANPPYFISGILVGQVVSENKVKPQFYYKILDNISIVN